MKALTQNKKMYLDPDFVDSSVKSKKAAPDNNLAYHLPAGDLQLATAGPNYLKLPKKQQVPKIYFGTRTHKQVSQIVRKEEVLSSC